MPADQKPPEHLFSNPDALDAKKADFLRAVGARLKALRQNTSTSLKTISARSGVSRSTIRAIEKGRSSCELWTITRVCAAMNVGLDALQPDGADRGSSGEEADG